MQRVKAVLLAAGVGSRLRPLTLTIPKCLIPVGGRPLMAYWFDALAAAGVVGVLINTHWLAGKVNEFVAEHADCGLKVTTSYEPVLLGSAGTIAANVAWFDDTDAILVIYADNYTTLELRRIIDFHFASSRGVTLGVFRPADLSSCGVVETDENGVGSGFEEKPTKPKGLLAAAGIYVFGPEAIAEVRRIVDAHGSPCDLGSNVLPALAKGAAIFEVTEPLIDIGTFGAYNAVQSRR